MAKAAAGTLTIEPIEESVGSGRMTAVLRVLAPGLLTTVQDLGRPGYQSRGIPVSGALDPRQLSRRKCARR